MKSAKYYSKIARQIENQIEQCGRSSIVCVQQKEGKHDSSGHKAYIELYFEDVDWFVNLVYRAEKETGDKAGIIERMQSTCDNDTCAVWKKGAHLGVCQGCGDMHGKFYSVMPADDLVNVLNAVRDEANSLAGH